MFASILKLITSFAERTPAPAISRELDRLFEKLRASPDAARASQHEELIWRYWMEHPDPAATALLARATRAIGTDQQQEAERILDRIIAEHPDFAEAWNKRATLRFLLERDADSLADITRTLELEPRHFGAICGFGQICLKHEQRDAALFAFDVALRIHPQLESIRKVHGELLRSTRPTAH